MLPMFLVELILLLMLYPKTRQKRFFRLPRSLQSANRNTGRSLQVLDVLVNSYQLLALTNNTSRVYSQGAKTSFNFCVQYNIPCLHPIQEQLLLYFAAHCAYHMKLVEPQPSILTFLVSETGVLVRVSQIF